MEMIRYLLGLFQTEILFNDYELDLDMYYNYTEILRK